MKLIVITPSQNLVDEYSLASYMLKNGLPTLHVRKPSFGTEAMANYLEHFSEEEHKKMVLHSHHRILLDYDLKGLHLSRRHRKKRFRSWLTQTLIELKRGGHVSLSTSCKSLSSMADNYNEFEYIMLTPVFTDPQGHRPSFSPSMLQQVIRNYPDKVIARGGTTADSIDKARDMGFAGIAFHNGIWTSPDPVKEFDKIINRFHQLGISFQ